MTENISNNQEQRFQNNTDYDEQAPGGRDGGTTDTDDEEVIQNDPDAMNADDLEGLDPDADMEEDDDDLLEQDEDDDDPAENETLGTP